jgi:hypothetical protein
MMIEMFVHSRTPFCGRQLAEEWMRMPGATLRARAGKSVNQTGKTLLFPGKVSSIAYGQRRVRWSTTVHGFLIRINRSEKGTDYSANQ